MTEEHGNNSKPGDRQEELPAESQRAREFNDDTTKVHQDEDMQNKANTNTVKQDNVGEQDESCEHKIEQINAESDDMEINEAVEGKKDETTKEEYQKY